MGWPVDIPPRQVAGDAITAGLDLGVTKGVRAAIGLEFRRPSVPLKEEIFVSCEDFPDTLSFA